MSGQIYTVLFPRKNKVLLKHAAGRDPKCQSGRFIETPVHFAGIRALGTPTRSLISIPTERAVSLNQISLTCEVMHIRPQLALQG